MSRRNDIIIMALMANYRRNKVTGGCYFFTANLADRSQALLVEHIDVLRNAFDYARNRYPFTINAIVVLPEHLHTIWTLPADDSDFALRWRLLKAAFSRALPRAEPRSDSRRSKHERGIWQRCYWEHLIRDEADYSKHVDYIHINPVKHGLVARVEDWPYSSFHRYVRAGTLPIDWAGDAGVELDCGERN